MKYVFIITLLICGNVYSQDNIVLKNGEEIRAKVLEIGIQEIKYKKHENVGGPTYTILKTDVFMIKYENGTKDIINKIESTEQKTTEIKEKPLVEKPINGSGKKTYEEKVRDIQSTDPAFSFYAGNAWLGGNGVAKPIVGFDVSLPRKNIFIRGINLGLRFSLAGTDNVAYESGVYSEVYAYTLSVKYVAPIPVKIVQPYIRFIAGAAYTNRYNFGSFLGSDLLPIVNVGFGANFMFLRHFGAFIETGYFTTGFINTGLVLKIGASEKRNSAE
jgi:hypothetical protein